jgi:hypothetical protein
MRSRQIAIRRYLLGLQMQPLPLFAAIESAENCALRFQSKFCLRIGNHVFRHPLALAIRRHLHLDEICNGQVFHPNGPRPVRLCYEHLPPLWGQYIKRHKIGPRALQQARKRLIEWVHAGDTHTYLFAPKPGHAKVDCSCHDDSPNCLVVKAGAVRKHCSGRFMLFSLNGAWPSCPQRRCWRRLNSYVCRGYGQKHCALCGFHRANRDSRDQCRSSARPIPPCALFFVSRRAQTSRPADDQGIRLLPCPSLPMAVHRARWTALIARRWFVGQI